MSHRLGQRVALFDEGTWHVGTIIGLRRPPNPGDDRTFIRLGFGDHVEMELQAGALGLMARSPVDRMALCAACWPSYAGSSPAADDAPPSGGAPR